MDAVTHSLVIVGFATASGILIRGFRRWIATPASIAVHEVSSARFATDEEYAAFLRLYALEDPHYEIPGPHLPLALEITSFIKSYKAIVVDGFIRYYNRSLCDVPYPLNTAFVHIGDWGDGSGSPVFVRRMSSDPTVYMVDVDEDEPEVPRAIATSIEAYMHLVHDHIKASRPQAR